MNNREMAEFILANKQEIMCIIGGYVDNFITYNEDRNNLFKESQYIRDLQAFIKDEVKESVGILMEDKLNYEELSLLFDDEYVTSLINKVFVREYLYN